MNAVKIPSSSRRRVKVRKGRVCRERGPDERGRESDLRYGDTRGTAVGPPPPPVRVGPR